MSHSHQLSVKQGFTLVELILYIALVGILLTAAAIFATDVVLGSIKGRVRAKVQHEATLALEKMRQEIVKGKNILAPSRESVTTKIENPNEDDGWWTSIAIGADGLPIISYLGGVEGRDDEDPADLFITKCANIDCSVSNPIKVETPQRDGHYSSIAIGKDNSFPIIAYRSNEGVSIDKLAIIRCKNHDCSICFDPVIINDVPNSLNASIAIGADDKPIIAHHKYISGTEGKLAVTKCTTSDCSEYTTPIIGTATKEGLFPSIAIGADGKPIISYYNESTEKLMVTKCIDDSCANVGRITTSISGPNPADIVGEDSSIAIDADGLPIISHYNKTQKKLAITKCANTACSPSGTNTTQIVSDSSSNVGWSTDIAIGEDGWPIIVYQDATLGDLGITKCNDDDCSEKITTKIPELNGKKWGWFASVAKGSDGLPIISHRYSTTDDSVPGQRMNGDLAITKCGNIRCSPDPINVLKLEIPGSPSKLVCFQVSSDGIFQMSVSDNGITKSDREIVTAADCNSTNAVWKDLTSGEVEVTALDFQNISSGTSLGEEAVKIKMTLKNKNQSGKKEFDAAVTVETSISLRL